jgi:hypothetical protein
VLVVVIDSCFYHFQRLVVITAFISGRSRFGFARI